MLEKVGSNAYRIKLPPTMKGVHPVFNVALLHDAPSDAIPGRVQKQPPPVEVEGQEEYKVEQILDSRFYRNGLQYLVKWKGYDDTENSWEPEANLDNAQEAIDDYYKAHPKRKRY